MPYFLDRRHSRLAHNANSNSTTALMTPPMIKKAANSNDLASPMAGRHSSSLLSLTP